MCNELDVHGGSHARGYGDGLVKLLRKQQLRHTGEGRYQVVREALLYLKAGFRIKSGMTAVCRPDY